MTKALVLITASIVSVIVPSSLGFSNGTSKLHHVCKTLKPHHNKSVPQTGAAPFQVTAASDRVPSGGPVLVSLESRTGTPFKGFMLQARPRPLRKLTPFGTFQLLDATRSKLMDCASVADGTATHNSPVPKTHISFKWFPPKAFRGDVYFEATFVQSFDIFWTKILKKVTVGPAAGDWSNDISNAIGQTDDSLNNDIVDAIGQTDDSLNNDIVDAFYDSNDVPVLNPALPFEDVYDGCGSVKQCFGVPQGCEQIGTCQTLVSITLQISRLEFEIIGTNSDYVAINLTQKDSPDKNLVVECVLLEEDVVINKMYPNDEQNSLFTSNIQLVHSSFVDGSIRCGFTQNHTRRYIEVHEFGMEKYSLELTSRKSDAQSENMTLFERVNFNSIGNSTPGFKDPEEKQKWSQDLGNKLTDYFMWLFMIWRFMIRLL